MFVMH